MSHSHAPEYRADITSKREILFIFVVFVVVLYLIFPSDILKEQAMKEKSNYALSAIYLENMLQLDPTNKKLLFAVISANLGSGQIDLAKRLIPVLRNSLKPEERYKLRILQYKIYMLQQQDIHDENKNIKIKKKMKKLLDEVAQSGEFQEKNAFVWYRYALALDQKEAALAFIKPIYEKGDKYALKQCLYLAYDLNKTQTKISCTQRLANADHNQSKIWLQSLYNIYTEGGDDKRAYRVLKKLANKDPKYAEELANFELQGKYYEESSKSFMFLYKKSVDAKQKKHFLLMAIQALIDSDQIDKAVALMRKHEDEYLKDDKMMNIFIKRYLAIERLQDAQRLSLKIMSGGSFE